MTTTIAAPDLRPVDLFEGISDSELDEWAAVAKPLHAEPGEIIAEQDEHPRGLLLLLRGTARTLMIDGPRADPVGRQRAPTWIAAIAVLTGEPLPVRMQADSECELAVVEPDDFRRLVFAQPTVHDRVLAQVSPVLSRVTAVEQNRERLASLGTMAAGLAHELNNPAAAARRAAAQLAETLVGLGSAFRGFIESGVELDQARLLLALHDEAVAGSAGRTALDALDAADAEEDLLERLEELGVPEPWTLAEPLAAAGVTRGWLDRAVEQAGDSLAGLLRWVAATVSANTLVEELCESTSRMSGLVGAVKSYAYMDRGELVETDVHEGLETTLVVLGHKLKRTTIEVERDYDRTLPKVTVRGSELNQVWTNLLDNAIDALGASGTIRVSTHRDGDCAVVEVADDGPGIPDELHERIFDSFFTTKEVGSGTGLGLSTARMIVVDRHDGALTFESSPGRTVFRVSIPITPAPTESRTR
jgi:signal transduction histidine kinase